MPPRKTETEFESYSLYCPLCALSLKELQSNGKIINRQGHIQCLDCHADMLTIEECLPHWERTIRAQRIAIDDLKMEIAKIKLT